MKKKGETKIRNTIMLFGKLGNSFYREQNQLRPKDRKMAKRIFQKKAI